MNMVDYIEMTSKTLATYSDAVRSQLEIGNVDKRAQVLNHGDLVADEIKVG